MKLPACITDFQMNRLPHYLCEIYIGMPGKWQNRFATFLVKSLFSCIFIPQKSAAAFGFSALNMPFPMSFRRTAGA
jgi:hypothetical protein